MNCMNKRACPQVSSWALPKGDGIKGHHLGGSEVEVVIPPTGIMMRMVMMMSGDGNTSPLSISLSFVGLTAPCVPFCKLLHL